MNTYDPQAVKNLVDFLDDILDNKTYVEATFPNALEGLSGLVSAVAGSLTKAIEPGRSATREPSRPRTCGWCANWLSDGTYQVGHCHAHAPISVSGVGTVWPTTLLGDHCGDFKREVSTRAT